MKAAYHSHTVVFEQRDGCSMVFQKVPGFALVRSTGDPDFRFGESCPRRTEGLDRLNVDDLLVTKDLFIQI
jgi:hypothetical protein